MVYYKSVIMRLTAFSLCAMFLPAVGLEAFGNDGAVTESTIEYRIRHRTFPSVFQAWNPADNLDEDPTVTEARHDLIFHGESFYGLQWDGASPGMATGFIPESIPLGLRRRQDLLQKNPNIILLLELRYRDAHRSFLPEGHAWWKRDADGKIVPGWEEEGYLQLDFSNPQFRECVAKRAEAAVKSGVVDGVMLDWWGDDEDRLLLVKEIRTRIGDDALILANANDTPTPRTAPFINGYFMECFRSQTLEDWNRIAATLTWAERTLRAPRINCVETWFHKSRSDEHLMRATTALVLVLSDGYCLFSDPNPLPTPDHLHNWYQFWEKRLGRPLAPGVKRPDGAMSRDFAFGTATYNPMGNEPVTISFGEPRTSITTGKRSRTHTVAPCDGDLFLKQ
ncbi:MAG: hypothetical protein KGQ87_09035 [Verrucomicrobia bacterium]|nr:hypothetical protein [Verrucomicrobiota bacterium]